VATQIGLWCAGIGWILHRFPQTRSIGDWLLRFPLVFIGISLGIWLSKPLMDSICRLILARTIDIIREKGLYYPRLTPRALSIFWVVNLFDIYLIVILGFISFCYFINALYFALIILAGLAFLVQNVLQDFIKTFFILSEDQYALGDVIKIGDVSGTVEKISLRNSQIRTMSGDLYIFSHSSFNQIFNFTHNQSGLKLAIDVAYSTDLDVAMAVVKEVAQGMQNDDHWSQYEIQADLKGVDNFGENSITLCLVLKTKLGDQWTVAREYRRRLKAAFDHQGISIPFPQRSIWFENGLPLERRSPNVSNP
jgi:small conductance mechanosensitive channel